MAAETQSLGPTVKWTTFYSSRSLTCLSHPGSVPDEEARSRTGYNIFTHDHCPNFT